MKHNQRTPVGKRRKSPSLLERIQPAAAGIDCGEKSHYVAVPRERERCGEADGRESAAIAGR